MWSDYLLSNAIKKAVADALSKAGSEEQAKVTPVKKDARSAKGRKGNAAGTFSTGSVNQRRCTLVRVRATMVQYSSVTVSGGQIFTWSRKTFSNSDDAPFFNRAKAVIGRLLEVQKGARKTKSKTRCA